MGYYESLTQMISSSGLTLKEIAEKCLDYGVKITPSYISKLQSTKQAPASDEVNVALAKACNWNVDNFLYDGCIEKSPELLKEILSETENFFRQLILQFSLNNYPSEIIPAIRKQQEDLTQYELIKHILNNSENIIEMITTTDKGAENNITVELGFTMSDNSMSPIINKDALLQIEVSEFYSNGEYVACLLNNEEILVRRYVEMEKNVILIPENKSYSVQFINKDDLKILGKIKSITHLLQ